MGWLSVRSWMSHIDLNDFRPGLLFLYRSYRPLRSNFHLPHGSRLDAAANGRYGSWYKRGRIRTGTALEYESHHTSGTQRLNFPCNRSVRRLPATVPSTMLESHLLCVETSKAACRMGSRRQTKPRRWGSSLPGPDTMAPAGRQSNQSTRARAESVMFIHGLSGDVGD
jgi:hypothetical protein